MNQGKYVFAQLAEFYQRRWAIELFFKWIKQHLKVKSFWGTTENAVKIQIYTAIFAYCLVGIVAYELKSEKSIYTILQILITSLLDKTSVNQLLTNNYYRHNKESDCNLLLFS